MELFEDLVRVKYGAYLLNYLVFAFHLNANFVCDLMLAESKAAVDFSNDFLLILLNEVALQTYDDIIKFIFFDNVIR